MSEEYTSTERAFLLGIEMQMGRGFTCAAVAERYGITTPGAYKLLTRVSRVAPVYVDIAPNGAHVYRILGAGRVNTQSINGGGNA